MIVSKFFNEKFFQRLGYWVSPLTVQNRLDRRQSVLSVVTYEGQAEKPERTKEIAGSGRGLSPTYKKTCTEVTQPNPISY